MTKAGFVILIVGLAASPCHAGVMINEDFNSGVLNSSLELTAPGSYAISGGAIRNLVNRRENVRTVDTDYTDFTYELTVRFTNAWTQDIAFIGVGAGQPAGVWREPGEGSINFRIHSPRLVGGRVDVQYLNEPQPAIGSTIGSAPYTNQPVRTRITRSGDLLSFELDNLYNGTFSADAATTYDLSLAQYANIKAALANESRLFFGSQYGSTQFDDMNVSVAATSSNLSSAPEPGSLLIWSTMLGGAGIRFRRRSASAPPTRSSRSRA